jgi:hypothetical protein
MPATEPRIVPAAQRIAGICHFGLFAEIEALI